MNHTDLLSYLPEFLTGYAENKSALEAENPEFDIIWKAADQTLKNEFIETANQYGISRFEKMLGILPSINDSLEARRQRVKIRWFSNLPYTMKMLVFKLTQYLGKDCDFAIDCDFEHAYLLKLIAFTADDSQKKELDYILNAMIPANVITDIVYEIATSDISIYFGGIMEQSDILEIKQR